jgi:hypothetical protein
VGHSGHSIIIALMMGTKTVPETLDFNELTRLSAREEFINFSRRENFTSYLNKIVNTDVMLLYFGGLVFFFLAKDCWPQNQLVPYLSILRPLLHRKGPL